MITLNPPNVDLNQDDIEGLIDQYTHPHVDVKYKVVKYRKGLLESLRLYVILESYHIEWQSL